MKINTNDLNSASGFYAVNFEVFAQTLNESDITDKFEMGGGVFILYGTRSDLPIWLMDNPLGCLYGIWIEENA